MKIGSIEYEVLEEVGEWDYSWHIGALLRGPDGQLYFAEDSGCSCYGFGDGIGEGDLIPVASWQEAVEKAKENFSEGEVFEFAKALAAR